MSCASCVATVEAAVKNLRGVEAATVNLNTGKALIRYDPTQAGIGDLERAIREVGYDVGKETLQLEITGMSCASCVESIEGAVRNLAGVASVAVSLNAGIAAVQYYPGAARRPVPHGA